MPNTLSNYTYKFTGRIIVPAHNDHEAEELALKIQSELEVIMPDVQFDLAHVSLHTNDKD